MSRISNHAYLTKINEPAAEVGTTYATTSAVKLGELAGDLRTADLPPAGAMWACLELGLDRTAGTPTTVEAVLAWDDGGDNIVWSTAAAVTLTAGITVTTRKAATLTLNIAPRTGLQQSTEGTLWLFLKVNNGTVAVTIARLHWYRLPGRGA